MDARTVLRDLALPVAMMAGFGALFWGIRGTGGYGGSMGALFAGIGWAVLWYFISNNDVDERIADGAARPLASRWAILAIGVGIMVGGFHGYGQFISWIKGTWRIIGGSPGVTVDVDPAWGFLGLLQCGLSWGGTAGAVLGWATPGNGDWEAARRAWIVRSALGGTGAIAGLAVALAFPGLLVPLYGSSYYSDLATCAQCTRAIETAISSAVQFGMFAGFLTAEIVLKNWRGVTTTAIMGGGFGLAFVIAAGWFFTPISWSWKAWEMSIGAIGGASIGITHFMVNRRVRKGALPNGSRRPVLLVSERMFLKPTWYEVVFGHNFPLALGLSASLYNGMKPGEGFSELFFGDDPVGMMVVMGITYVVISAMWVFFGLSVANKIGKRPATRIWFGKPLLQVAVVQVVMAAIGFMTTLVPVVPLPASTAAVAATYVIGIVVGGIAIAGVVILDLVSKKEIV